MTEAGKRLLAFLRARTTYGNYRNTADASDIAAIEAEAVAAERARIVAGVEAEASERIEDDGNIGRRAYGSLGIEPSGSGYIEVVGRTAVLRIVEGGSE